MDMKRYIILLTMLLAASFAWAQGDDVAVVDDAATVEDAAVQAAEPTQQALSLEALWSRANDSYAAGEYDVALADYEAILNQGKYSAVLYYNLANTYFKLDQLGKAILYYNRALRLSPTDEDIRHNLEYAEQMTKDSIEEIPEFVLTTWMKAVRGVCSATAWTIISLIMLVLSLSMALVYLLAHRLSLRKTGFYVMAVAGLLFIVTTLFALSERELVVDSREAIVMNSAVSIKSSPDRAAVELFVLHEGTKVYIGSEMAGWAEVRIADGRKGWIETNRIEKI
jgi:tetratricopeptide (TPR) repeat protein